MTSVYRNDVQRRSCKGSREHSKGEVTATDKGEIERGGRGEAVII